MNLAFAICGEDLGGLRQLPTQWGVVRHQAPAIRMTAKVFRVDLRRMRSLNSQTPDCPSAEADANGYISIWIRFVCQLTEREDALPQVTGLLFAQWSGSRYLPHRTCAESNFELWHSTRERHVRGRWWWPRILTESSEVACALSLTAPERHKRRPTCEKNDIGYVRSQSWISLGGLFSCFVSVWITSWFSTDPLHLIALLYGWPFGSPSDGPSYPSPSHLHPAIRFSIQVQGIDYTHEIKLN